jgi:hypothetical protein
MHQILGHYLRSISLIRMREMHVFLSMATVRVIFSYVKDMYNKYFTKIIYVIDFQKTVNSLWNG